MRVAGRRYLDLLVESAENNGWLPERVESKAPNRNAPVLTPYPSTTPIYPRSEFRPIAQAAYHKNELVFAAIERLVNLFCSAPMRVWDGKGNTLNEHPIRALIKRPNPFMGEYGLFEMLLVYYKLAGNAFLEKVRDASGQVVELWPLRPDRVQIVPSKTDYVAGYIYQIQGTNYPLDREDVIHFRAFDPLDDYWGMPCLLPALRQVAVDNEATDFSKVMLQNFGIPGVTITTQSAIDEPLAERLLLQYKRKFTGTHRGEPMFLQNGMDVKPLGFDLRQLAFADLRNISETRILMAIGVPPIMISAKSGLERNTYSNYGEARRSMYEDTVDPLHKRFDDQLEISLLADFPTSGDIELGFDDSEVPALANERQQAFTNAKESVLAGISMVSEGRAEIGLDEVPGTNVFLRPTTSVAVKEGEDPTAVKPTVPVGQAAVPAANPEAAGTAARATDTQAVEAKAAKQPQATFGKQKADVRAAAKKRTAIADKYHPQIKAKARMLFRSQARDVTHALHVARKALTPDQAAAITAELATLEGQWAQQASDQIGPVIAGAVSDAGNDAAASLGIKFDLSNQDVVDFIKKYAFKFAQQISETSAQDVRDLLTQAETEGWSIDELSSNLEAKFEGWDSTRADLVARTESIRAANAGALESYKQAGITQKIWLADDDACPYCAGLDGTVIGIDDNFLDQGQKYQPDGAEKPMDVSYDDVNGPPAHPNCRCAVAAQVE